MSSIILRCPAGKADYIVRKLVENDIYVLDLRVEVSQRKKRKKRKQAVLPGYLFVRFIQVMDVTRCRREYDLPFTVLCHNEQYMTVKDAELRRLTDREPEALEHIKEQVKGADPVPLAHSISIGDHVRMAGAMWARATGKVTKVFEDRCSVELGPSRIPVSVFANEIEVINGG